MQINKEHVEHALRTFFSEGDVFEIRILNAITKPRGFPHTENGFFDYAHIGDVCGSMGHIQSALGVYVTVNPVNPLLLNRKMNRISVAQKGESTADTDIIERRWLLVDCDAKRKGGITGIPSDFDEHSAALSTASRIVNYMTDMGFHQPIRTDSGNGAQLMYRISMMNDAEDLVKRTIAGIAGKFTDDKVDVDTTVYNPARIWRLPGTMNCKGDSNEERPHRMCRIMDVPEPLEINLIEKLNAVAVPIMTNELYTSTTYTKITDFSIEKWIMEYCPDIAPTRQNWKDGHKWVFDVCPFNRQHNNRSAVLMQLSNGAIAFKCHHNGCSGKTWHDLRELLEPGYSRFNSRSTDYNVSDVNLDAIQAKAKDMLEEFNIRKEQGEIEIMDYNAIFSGKNNDAPWNNVTDDDVENVLDGTLLGRLVDVFKTPVRPNLPLSVSLPKALAVFSTILCGEADEETLNMRYGGNMGSVNLDGTQRARVLINAGGGLGCNIYSLIIGESASGKDIGNLIDKFVSMENPSAKVLKLKDGTTLKGDYNLGNAGSSEGISEMLVKKPNGLLNINEFQNYLDEKHWQSHAASFLTAVFNKGTFSFSYSSRGGKSGEVKCKYALPSIIANVQPDILSSMMTDTNMTNGFMARFMFFVMPDGFNGRPNVFDSFATVRKIEEIKAILEQKQCIVDVPFDYMEDMHGMFEQYASRKSHIFWRRLVNEYYPKLATFLAIRLGDASPSITITGEDWDKAKVMIAWIMKMTEKTICTIEDRMRVRNGNRNCNAMQEVFRVIYRIYKEKKRKYRDSDKHVVTLTDINFGNASYNNVRLKASERREIINDLVDMGIVERRTKGYVISNEDMIPAEWK